VISVRSDDGARAIGAIDDVGGRWRAARATGSSTTDRKICSTDRGSAALTSLAVNPRARGALGDQTDPLEPAGRRFGNFVFAIPSDGVRAFGANAGVAAPGALWELRGHRQTGGIERSAVSQPPRSSFLSPTRAREALMMAGAGGRVNLLDLGLAHARGWGADADDGTGGAVRARGWRATAIGGNKAIVNPTALPTFCMKSLIPTNVYASAIGLCIDSIITQSSKPSNSDF
jgi:hypothetical protein